MRQLDTITGHLVFAVLALALLGAPWLFGAWEAWYFWPFAGLIFLATAGLGVRLALSAYLGVQRLPLTTTVVRLVLWWLPFLAYAVIRGIQAPVRMDAERSVLLHVTAFLVAVTIIIGLETWHRRWLAVLLTLNFLLLAGYGIGNHFLAGNATVLWVPGFPQYQEGYFRATGTYFCPDHFAGLMELGLCVALAALLARAVTWRQCVVMLSLAAAAVAGIVLSKSRGGGIVTAGILGCGLWWGLSEWTPRQRLLIRLVAGGASLLAVAAMAWLGTRYVERFKQYPWSALEQSDRYQMTAAALRGWKSAPLEGIGPGMHQNYWPHFAPSADGDRARGIWPRHLNNTFHSYEAHDDWAQLLEEYGAIGMALFLAAAGRTWWRLREKTVRAGAGAQPWALAAMLGAAAMALHSIGDFNLQIPATTWVLAAMVALGLATGDNGGRRRRPVGGLAGTEPGRC